VSVTDETAPSAGEGGDAPGRPRRSRAARNAAIVVGVVLVAVIVLLATRGANDSASSRIVGQAAPDFSGETLEGEAFRLSAHRGEWVLVNFFATWCTPCILEHPELVSFAESHRDDPVEVVSVAYGNDQAAALREFFAEAGGDWPVIPADTGRIALDYGVTGVPETYVVAPSGQVVARFEGVTARALDELIEEAGGMSVAFGGS
jgi:cytochrome c biogenesis protein CcmG/thiol:disulfide interchange protein DsbE